MDNASLSPEQQQLMVEMQSVLTNLEKQGGGDTATYEIEQGRKLIEKAVKINLPEQSYAELQRLVASHTGR